MESNSALEEDETLFSSSLLDLPDHLLHYICQHLDRQTTGCLASSCKWLNQVCAMHAKEIRLPANDALIPPSSFFCCLQLQASITRPSPDNTKDMNCSCVVTKPSKWPSIRRLIVAGARSQLNPYHFHTILQQLSLLFRTTITSLVLSGLKLTAPPPLFILQAIPVSLFPNLESIEIVNVRIGCPASAAKWEAVGGLLTEIMHYEDSDPRPGQIDALVVAHEAIMQEAGGNGGGKNVIVAMELCRSLSCLRGLKRLVLTGHKTLHLHNIALSFLSSCTRLESLEISLPSVWPFVTARSIQALPPSLDDITLHTYNPATVASLLRSVQRPKPLRCHIKTVGYGGTAYPGYEKWREALDNDSLSYESRVAMSNGALSPSFTFTGRPPSVDDSLVDGIVPQLTSLSIKSSVPDLDPLVLNPGHLSAWNERQGLEFKVLKWILSAHLELKRLELTNVGPSMMSLLCNEMERVFDGLALERLSISCHSNVDPSPLLFLSRPSDLSTPSMSTPLSLSVRGLSKSQIASLVDFTASSCPIEQKLSLVSITHSSIHLSLPPSFLDDHERLCKLVELHVQRVSDLLDEDVAMLFTQSYSLQSLLLSSCRSISSEVVDGLGRMRRKLKLSVSLCRLIDSRSWLSAVRQVSQLKGVVVLDVKVPKRKDNGIGQAEDTKDDTSCDWCCVEFGP